MGTLNLMENAPEPSSSSPGDIREDRDDTCTDDPRDDLTCTDATSADDLHGRADDDPGDDDSPWWDDPGMPWKHKPGKSDYWCMGWIGFLGLFSLAMLPLRGWLLGLSPQVLLGVTGSRTGAAATGALVSVGTARHWYWWMLLGSLMSIKLDWVYWWAGKLWGRGMIEVWAGASERSAKNYERMERWAIKLGWLGILVAYLPIPLPLMPVIFVLAGASGMSILRFVILDFVAATVWNGGFILAGYAIGDPAVDVLNGYAKIANWVALGLVAVVVVIIMRRSAKNAKGGASRKAGTGHTADDPGSGRSDAVQAGGSARAAEASGVGDSQDSVMSRAPRRAQNPD